MKRASKKLSSDPAALTSLARACTKSLSGPLWMTTCCLSLILTAPSSADDDLLHADFELGDVSSWSSVFGGSLPVAPAAFRVNLLELRDPHLFANNPLTSTCEDLTQVDNPLFGSINTMIADGIDNDTNGDGYLDISLMLLFRSLDQSTEGPVVGEVVDLRGGRCAPPADSTTCSVDSPEPKARTTYTNASAGTCLHVEPGTTGPYTPAPMPTVGPCFATDAIDFTFEVLVEIPLPLQDFQVSATYDHDPADELLAGLARGFLSKTDADSTLLPGSIPLAGGRPISDFLADGTETCPPGNDLDPPDVPDGGWWFYFYFEAERVPWTGL